MVLGKTLMVLGKISHLKCGHKGQMQGITPEPAQSWGRSHTLLIMFIYTWCNINRVLNKFVCVWNNEAVSMAHLILLWLETKSYWVQILVGSDVSHRGCFYTVLQTVQRHGVCSDVYGTVHYKEPLELFDKSSPFLLLRYCHACAESNIHLKWRHVYRWQICCSVVQLGRFIF